MSWSKLDFRLAVAPLLLAILVFVSVAASRKEAPSRRCELVSPKDGAVLSCERVDLICRGHSGSLRVNGKARKWEPFSSPLSVATLELPAGRHEIRVGEETLTLMINPDARPTDPTSESAKPSNAYACHPMRNSGKKRCGVCHETTRKDGVVNVGKPKSYEACFTCHKEVDFELDHSHILEPLETCSMCHSMHGARYKSLLKAPMRRLCEECHDPDH